MKRRHTEKQKTEHVYLHAIEVPCDVSEKQRVEGTAVFGITTQRSQASHKERARA